MQCFEGGHDCKRSTNSRRSSCQLCATRRKQCELVISGKGPSRSKGSRAAGKAPIKKARENVSEGYALIEAIYKLCGRIEENESAYAHFRAGIDDLLASQTKLISLYTEVESEVKELKGDVQHLKTLLGTAQDEDE